MKNILSVILIAFFCSACTSLPMLKTVSEQDRQWLLSGKALVQQADHELPLPEERVLYLNKEMREFAENAVRGFEGVERVRALLGAILNPSGLNLKYDVEASFTAEEVFNKRRANCLAFTNIFVAMGRYVDMDVQYNEVDVPPIWDLRRENTLVLNKHINAMVTINKRSRHVIDLNVEEYDSLYEQRNVSDQLAVAQHYNNKAMAYLVDEDYSKALRFIVKAINMAPHKSYLWNNLGALYRRSGNLQAAETSYLISLKENSDDLVAISNMARLYKAKGELGLANYYKDKAHNYRMRNPYFLYGLAQRAFVERDYDLAMERTEEAIFRYDKEHRFYFLLAAIYHQSGERQLADDNLNKALELSGDSTQQGRYIKKMERIASLSS